VQPAIFYTRKTSRKTLIFFHFFIALILLNFSPKTVLADGKGIFDKNKGSVVILYSYDKDGKQIGRASGFIVRKDGVVVTNYHFISNAAEIKIQTDKGRLDVKGVLYADKKNDIAMLKTEDKNFPVIKIHETDIGPEGQKIYMIGSPQGEDKILFDGTLRRIKDISHERKLLLITAPVTKGCSGSPVFNENGEVIGIATYFIEETQPYYFAVPVEQIKSKLSLKKVTPLHKAGLIVSEKTAEHWFNLGMAYESLSLYIYASGAYQKAIEINPKDATSHNNLGVVYTMLEIYSFAIREHTEAIRLNPDYQEAYFNLGIAYEKSGMYQKAIETFEKAIRLKPDDAKSHNNLAVIFFKSGKLKEAIDSFKQAIRIKPDYPEAYYNLGVSYCQMNMNRDAIDAFKESIRMNPDLPKAHFGLGLLYTTQDAALALKEYEILKKLDPRGADVLHKIIETRENISSEPPRSSQDTAKEKITQAETIVASQKETSSSDPSATALQETPYLPAEAAPQKEVQIHESSAAVVTISPEEASPPAVPAAPQKENPLSQTADASVTEPILPDKIEGAGNTANPETTRNSDQISEKVMYAVQVSVSANEKNALSLIQRLRKKGYNAFLKIEYKVDQNTRYRVLVGSFAEKKGAEEQAQIILNKEKMETVIFKHPKLK